MYKILLFMLLCSCCIGCSDAPSTTTPAAVVQPPSGENPSETVVPEQPQSRETLAPPPVQTFQGLFRSGAAGSTFYDCASGNTYRVGSKPANLDSLYQMACAPAPYLDESVFAVVRGFISPEDSMLRINRVDTLRAKTMYTTCLPYDFWCIGTEPFWGLVISEKEAGLFLKLIGEERGKVFPISAPQTSANSWVYLSVNPETKEKLKVVVRKGPCSDGMSDRSYNYTVELSLGKQTLHGCAVRYGEFKSPHPER